MKMFDGCQRISSWPEEIVEYVSSNPNRQILLSQSIRSEHKLLYERTMGKRIFIGYNKNLKCFAAWNLAVNSAGCKTHDYVFFSLGENTKRNFDFSNIQGISSVYTKVVKGGHTVYQKVCIFKRQNFIQFYENFQIYMKPEKSDLFYKHPVYDFSDDLQIIK